MVESFISLQTGNFKAGNIVRHFYAKYNPWAFPPTAGSVSDSICFDLLETRTNNGNRVKVGESFDVFRIIITSDSDSSSGKEEVTVWPLGTMQVIQLQNDLLEVK